MFIEIYRVWQTLEPENRNWKTLERSRTLMLTFRLPCSVATSVRYHSLRECTALCQTEIWYCKLPREQGRGLLSTTCFSNQSFVSGLSQTSSWLTETMYFCWFFQNCISKCTSCRYPVIAFQRDWFGMEVGSGLWDWKWPPHKKKSCPFLSQSRQQQIVPSHSAFWPSSLFHYFDFGMTSVHV